MFSQGPKDPYVKPCISSPSNEQLLSLVAERHDKSFRISFHSPSVRTCTRGLNIAPSRIPEEINVPVLSGAQECVRDGLLIKWCGEWYFDEGSIFGKLSRDSRNENTKRKDILKILIEAKPSTYI